MSFSKLRGGRRQPPGPPSWVATSGRAPSTDTTRRGRGVSTLVASSSREITGGGVALRVEGMRFGKGITARRAAGGMPERERRGGGRNCGEDRGEGRGGESG